MNRHNQIPIEDFFRNPEKTAFKISPDGANVSWLASFEHRLNIFIKPVNGDAVKRLTDRTDRDIRTYFWLNDHQIAFLQDTHGDENEHLYIADISTGITTDHTPFKDVKVQIIDELEDEPHAVLIAMNRRDPVVFDVYRLHTNTGELILEEENPGNITSWITDQSGAIRMAVTTDGVNTSLLERTGPGSFHTVVTTSFRETLYPLFFDFENKTAYALSNIGRDKVAIVRIDPHTGSELEMIFSHPEVDAGDLGYSRKRKVITAAIYTTWKTNLAFLDPVTEDRYKKLRALLPGNDEIYITARTKQEDLFIVRTLSDVSLGNYYLYNDTQNTITQLADVAPWLQAEALCPMRPMQYTARDGRTIHGYLTLPHTAEQKGLPVIIHPHGGPWARDVWHFNPEVQFLANRGYAVLQMNFRGSTGYGRDFLEASFKQWGKTMQDDITDGVEYLIREGIADKDRIGIYGASYGGYATLAGLTFTPDLYACGVDYVGVSSLFTFMETIPPYWKPYLDMMYEMVGHPENDRELLASASPLLHIDQIKAPLFVAQGAMDPRVKKSESDQIVEALRARGVEVEYMVRDNEGHGFMNQENKFAFYRAMEEFLHTHLQSRS